MVTDFGKKAGYWKIVERKLLAVFQLNKISSNVIRVLPYLEKNILDLPDNSGIQRL